MSKEPVLEMRSVGSFLTPEMRFFIPDYQRGYRWGKDQILALLNDLNEFENSPDSSGFYCLQPLVVVRRDDEWEVVDGQQRLTTIFLILRHLQQGVNPFSIRYKRHPQVDGGLNGLIQSQGVAPDGLRFISPDLHYLESAERIIKGWFSENPGSLENVLTAVSGRCARFIWYQVSPLEAIQTFKNLNAGKVRLTDAELIRALLLRSDQLPDEERQQIALRWDQMERRLQEPEFWAFLTSAEASENRIDWLFRLVEGYVTGRQLMRAASSGNRQVFDHVFKRMQEEGGRQQFWDSVEHVFSTLEEWFAIDHLFHHVGLLVMLGASLNELLSEAKDGKEEFVFRLKKKIRDRIFGSGLASNGLAPALARVEYPDSNVKAVLLCLNVAVLDADLSRSVRLSFSGYKATQWDIEHIRATASAEPKTDKDYVATLEAIAAYWETPSRRNSSEYANQVEMIRSALIEVHGERPDARIQRLSGIYITLRDQMEGNEKDLGASDGLKNLTLLPASINRCIGAQPFAVKRVQILREDLRGAYLLPCTRHVFSKSFTPAPSSLLCWTAADAESYMSSILQMLDGFFTGTWERSS